MHLFTGYASRKQQNSLRQWYHAWIRAWTRPQLFNGQSIIWCSYGMHCSNRIHLSYPNSIRFVKARPFVPATPSSYFLSPPPLLPFPGPGRRDACVKGRWWGYCSLTRVLSRNFHLGEKFHVAEGQEFTMASPPVNFLKWICAEMQSSAFETQFWEGIFASCTLIWMIFLIIYLYSLIITALFCWGGGGVGELGFLLRRGGGGNLSPVNPPR